MKKPRKHKLPTTLMEAEALAFARERIAFYRDNPWKIWGEVEQFSAESGRRWLVEKLKILCLGKPEWLMLIVDNARQGSDMARDALKELMLDFHNRRTQMPLYLESYNMDVINGKLGPIVSGPKPVDRTFSEFAIAQIVLEVAQRFNLNPTRNRYSGRPCGCSIVADATIPIMSERKAIPIMSERKVEKIWQQCNARKKEIENSIP